MAAYEYRVPSLFKVSADVAGSVCEELQRSEGGLTPATLLEASRDISAPLHREFEWNDDKAAEKYRLAQARVIINNLVLVSMEEGVKRVDRAFVNVRPAPVGTYVAMRTAFNSDEWTRHLLTTAKGEMESFIAKYRRLEQLAGVIEAMKDAIR